jgi:hypothetical protein
VVSAIALICRQLFLMCLLSSSNIINFCKKWSSSKGFRHVSKPFLSHSIQHRCRSPYANLKSHDFALIFHNNFIFRPL